MSAIRGMMVRTLMTAVAAVLVSAGCACGGTNEWTQIGPKGNGITSVAVEAATPSRIYIGTNGGVYRSDDDGVSWRLFSEGIGIEPIRALTQTNAAIFAVAQDGIFKYSSGDRWVPTAPVGSGNLSAVVASPSNPARLVAITSAGALYFSTNNGGTWGTLTINQNVRSLAFDTSDENTMYAATATGVYVTTNGGGTWAAKNTGLTSTNVAKVLVQEDHAILAATAKGVFRSTNGGDSWNALPGPLSGTPVAGLFHDRRNAEILWASGVPPLAGGIGGTFRSDDNGENWTKVPDINLDIFIGHPATPATLYAATTEGLGKISDAGKTWTNIGYEIYDTSINSLAIPSGSSTASLFAATLGKPQKLVQEGWQEMNLPSPSTAFAVVPDPVAPQQIYALTMKGIYNSNDNGENWQLASFWLGAPEKTIYSLLINPEDPAMRFAGSTSVLYKSTDDSGANWIPSNINLNGKNISSLAADPSWQKLYAASSASPADGGGVYKSSDNGANWAKTSTANISSYVRAILLTGSSPAKLVAGTAAGIFTSVDDGDTWKQAGGTKSLSVRALAQTILPPASLYAAATTGLYRSLDGGENWTIISSDLPPAEITSVAVDSRTSPPTIYAGTYGNSIYSVQITDTEGPSATATPSGGTYGVPQNVALASEEGAAVFYTTDGSTPTLGSARYQTPLTLWSGKKTLKFIAADKWGNAGTVKTEEYVFDTTPPKLTLNGFNAYTNQTVVTLSGSTEEGATVKIATDTAASDGPATVNGTNWSYHLTGLPAGETAITVTATDAAGNSSVITAKINHVPGLGTTVFRIRSGIREGHGKIEPAEPVIVPRNGSQTFTFIPDEGYHLEAAGVNNWAVRTRNNTYTIKNVRKHMLIEAVFELNEYRITAPARRGGTVKVLTRTVEHGKDGEVRIIAKKGWEIDTVTIDDEPVSGPFASPCNLVVPNVTGPRKVIATFRKPAAQ